MISSDSTSTAGRFDSIELAWALGDGPCGPAGLTLIDLVEGVTVLADHADPSQLVEVRVSASAPNLGPSQIECVRALLGSKAAAHVADGSRSEGVETTVHVEPSTATTRRLVGRLALLLELRGTRVDAPSLWAAEAAYLAHLTDVRVGLQPLAPNEAVVAGPGLLGGPGWPPAHAARLAPVARVVATLLADTHPDLAGALTDRVRRENDGAVDRRDLDDGEVEARFRRLAVGLDDRTADHRRGSLVAAGSLLRGERRSGSRAVMFAIDVSGDISGALDAGRPGTGRWDSAQGLLELRLPVTAEAFERRGSPLWAVVRLPRQDLTLAMSILEPESPHDARSPMGVVRLLLPVDIVLADLAMTLTVDPQSLTEHSGRRHPLRAALEAGRTAALAERLGRWENGFEAWETCATRWAVLGDVDRQAIALSRAARCLDQDGDAAEADVVRERLRGLPLTWAASCVEARPGPEPFLAELLADPDDG